MSSLSRIDMDISGRSKEIPEVALRNLWRGKMNPKNNVAPFAKLWKLWQGVEEKGVLENEMREGKPRSNEPRASQSKSFR